VQLAALGAGERLRPLWEQLGLRSLYLGDEAVVDTRVFSLEGRPIRKVRQSVTRLEKQGYAAEVRELREFSDTELHELEAVSRSWRGGQVERGFSMSLDDCGATTMATASSSWAATARDGSGASCISLRPTGAQPSPSRRCVASATRQTG
jgi:lysyl-tRNA synthetase class 2